MPSQTPEIRFSSSELEALLAAAAQAEVALPSGESLSLAKHKLKALAASERATPLSRLNENFETWNCGSKDYLPHGGRITLLIEAILRKRRCQVEYQAPSRPEPKAYDYDPYRLLFAGGGLYVVGRVPKHTGTATLAVDRLRSLALSNIEFEMDPEFDPRKCRLDAFGVSWQDPMEVVLHFGADQAPYVRERLWHPSQTLTDLPDGDIQLTFRAGGPFEIRRWILGWGEAVEVISPDELRREIKEALISAAGTYEER